MRGVMGRVRAESAREDLKYVNANLKCLTNTFP